MAVDQKIKEAIETASLTFNQSPTLALQLTSWFEAVAMGNEDIHNKQEAYRHLELLCDSVQLETAVSNLMKLDELNNEEFDEEIT